MRRNGRAKRFEVGLERCIGAPASRVWEIVRDHERMPSWSPAREVVRRQAGEGDPDGIGAVRVVRIAGLAIEERVIDFKPERRIAVLAMQGGPFRDCASEMELLPEGDATRVRWRVAMRPLLPGTGWLLRRGTARLVRSGLSGVARLAEAP